MRTTSYSSKLVEFSKYYRKFSNILEVRTISAEYLIAMKLRAGRKYKNDISDIIGILAAYEKNNIPITFEMVNKAVMDLYGSWADFSSDSKQFIEDAIKSGNYETIYASVENEEKQVNNILTDFIREYPCVDSEANAEEIIKVLKAKESL